MTTEGMSHLATLGWDADWATAYAAAVENERGGMHGNGSDRQRDPGGEQGSDRCVKWVDEVSGHVL